jgi:hypothetical protein
MNHIFSIRKRALIHTSNPAGVNSELLTYLGNKLSVFYLNPRAQIQRRGAVAWRLQMQQLSARKF